MRVVSEGKQAERTSVLQPGEPAYARLSSALWRDRLLLVLLAFALVMAAFFLQVGNEINLNDEGYLWYGGFAASLGQVPVRDFQAYDAGRNYWVAAWFLILRDHGIVSLRIACAALNFFGILCGLLVIRRLTRAWYLLGLGGGLLTLWVFPPFMLNHNLALSAVYCATLLVERPSRFRHFVAGLGTGLAMLLVGRHLFAYTLPASVLPILFVWYRIDRHDLLRRILAWGGGLFVGQLPLTCMMIFVPGFSQALLDMFHMFIFEMGTSNLHRLIPWPWQHFSLWDICFGLFFVCAPVFYMVSAGWLVLAKREACVTRPVLVAATLVGIPFLHYAFARADIEHLAMSVQPFILAAMALPAELPRQWRRLTAGLVLAVAAASVVAIGGVSPLYQRLAAPPGRYRPLHLGGWTVWEPSNHAGLIEGAIRFNSNVLRPDEGFLIAPQLPALYPILNRLSPVWQVTFIFPHAKARQQRMIEDLERNRVNWFLLEDVPTDGRDDLRFRYTHRLMWEYINQNFEVVPEGLLEDFKLFKRKIPIGAPSPAAGHSTPG